MDNRERKENSLPIKSSQQKLFDKTNTNLFLALYNLFHSQSKKNSDPLWVEPQFDKFYHWDFDAKLISFHFLFIKYFSISTAHHHENFKKLGHKEVKLSIKLVVYGQLRHNVPSQFRI